MPYRIHNVRRRTAAEVGQLLPEQVEFLFDGNVLLPTKSGEMKPFRDDQHAKGVWDDKSELLLKWWIEGFPNHLLPSLTMALQRHEASPGSRPWAWWRWSSGGIRRRALGASDLVPRAGTVFSDIVDRDLRPGEEAEIWAENERQMRSWECPPDHAVSYGRPTTYGCNYPYRWESEFDCLKRHGVLSKAEIAAVGE